MIAAQALCHGTGGSATPESVAPVVFVVDDDAVVREGLESLVRSAGWHAKTFACAQQFLGHPPPPAPSCLVLDVSLPGINGFDLQKRMAAERIHVPLIFVAGYGDVPTAVRAMKCGAVDFLTKPFSDTEMLDALGKALDRSRTVLMREAETRSLRDRHASLTPREREVMALVVAGLLNKQVGGELGICEVTVKAHRGSVMRKMKARSLPDLVNIASRLRPGTH